MSIMSLGDNLLKQMQETLKSWDMIRFTKNKDRPKMRDAVYFSDKVLTQQGGEILSFVLQFLALVDRVIETEELQHQTLVQTAFFTCPTLYDYPVVMESPCYDKTSSKTHLETIEGMATGNPCQTDYPEAGSAWYEGKSFQRQHFIEQVMKVFANP